MAEATRRQVAAYLATAATGLASLGTSYGDNCEETVEVEGEVELADGRSDDRRFRLRTTAPIVSIEVAVEVTSPQGLLDVSLRVGSASTRTERLGAGVPAHLSARLPPCPTSEPCSAALVRNNDTLDVELTLRFNQVKGDSTVTYRVSATTEQCGLNPVDEDVYYLELDAT